MFTLRNLWIVPMRGVGQVMFQENALSGALMLLGIAVGSPAAALLALAGNVLGNLAARVFRYPAADIERGLYGFNGTLVGIAVGVFFPLGWQAALLLIAGSVASSPIARIFARCRIPGFTAPFILSTWLLLGIAALLWPALRTSGGTAAIETAPEWLQVLSLHFGQVMFEGRSLLTGALFLAGIAVNDRRGALYALWGALLPLGMAFFADDYAAFNAGLYGYNGVLCAIALAGPSAWDFARATCAVLLSIALQWFGMQAGIVTLTAPFVMAVWIVMAADRIFILTANSLRPNK